MRNARVAKMAVVVMLLLLEGGIAVAADSFYAGKTVTVFIGTEPGGGYDMYARLLSRHIQKHIPGKPNIIAVNKPGAGSLIAANYLYNQAKPNGLSFLAMNHAVIMRQLLGDPKVKLDVRKMNWIGSISGSPNLCIVRKGAPYQKVEEMIGSRQPTILAATPETSRETYSKLLAEVLGVNFKIITGYRSGGAIYVAIESGEADGGCGIGWDSIQPRLPQWEKDKSVSVFLQIDPTGKISELPNVPWLMDFVKTQDDRDIIHAGMATQAIVRSFVAPPGVPAERMTVLRRAFAETLKDPAFLADAAKMNLPVNPWTAGQIEGLIKQLFNTRQDLLDKLRTIFFPKGF